jgi:hypothetical protein
MAGIDPRQRLIEQVASYAHDPLGFVFFAFPWGEPGTELADASGARDWQCALLAELGRRLREGSEIGNILPILMARASGHGVGKSTVAAWVILWGLSTMPNTRIVVTANTDAQLRTKTWPEVIKWLRLMINRDWFKATATAVFSAEAQRERLWRADAIPWSEENTEAFAGLHNKRRRVILIFDEASAIADKIWEVSEGALTDEGTEIIWLAFGNPTRNSGRFRECFGRFRHPWDMATSTAGRSRERTRLSSNSGSAITARIQTSSGSGCAACSRMRARCSSFLRSWSRLPPDPTEKSLGYVTSL